MREVSVRTFYDCILGEALLCSRFVTPYSRHSNLNERKDRDVVWSLRKRKEIRVITYPLICCFLSKESSFNLQTVSEEATVLS